jgi:hypothetical protein
MKLHNTFTLLLAVFLLTDSYSQQSYHRLPSNFTGAEAGFDLLHFSFAVGIGYERMISQGNKAALGMKGKYFFRHKNDTIKRQQNDTRPIYASQLQLMLKGYLYLDKQDKPYGVFFMRLRELCIQKEK